MATLLDASALSGFSQVFAFLIIFIVTYVVLQTMKPLNMTKGISGVLALAFSLLTIMSPTAIKIVKLITPYYAVFMFLILILIMVSYQVGGDISHLSSHRSLVITVVIISVLIFFAALGQIYLGPTLSKEYSATHNGTIVNGDSEVARPYFLSIILDPRVVGVLALITICGLAIFFIGLDK
jgi:hypothetical protein